MIAPGGTRFSNGRSNRGPGAVEIVDEAVAFLRRTPLSILVIYYAGALPFSLALIYFVFDMMQGVYAERHLGVEALLLTFLYFWMKTCQAVFSRKLLATLEGEDPEPWSVRRWANTAILQAVYAGTFFIVYPIALLITIPFGWVNAFYHSISIVATSAKSTLRSSFAEAAELSGFWPRQNHLIIAVQLAALLFLFLNLAVFFSMIPQLLDMLFGLSTIFDENKSAWNNSSFYLDVSVFCFLVLNPLSKAIYVLRLFYGRARFDGADLRAELNRQRRFRQVQTTTAVILLSLAGMTTQPVFGDNGPTPQPSSSAPPAITTPAGSANLDHAIQKTLEKDEFAWRMPRPAGSDRHENMITRILEKFLHFLGASIKALLKPIWKFVEWLMGSSKSHDVNMSGAAALAAFPWTLLFVVILVLAVAILVWLVIRNIQRKALLAGAVIRETIPVKTVDLESENVRADDLPEDSWLSLAQELMDKGESRLALRAFYLATLSLLAHRQLIRLGPAKSNRDYLQEFTRRLRGDVATVPPFRENIRLFEASWYGTHVTTATIIDAMRANHQNLRTHVAA
jgi:hypothetical protein